MSGSNRNTAVGVQKLQRQQQALELRRMALSYREIAAKIGVSYTQAHRLIEAGLTETKAAIAGEADHLRAEELSRLDGLLKAVWPAARTGHLGAVDRVIRIGERRAKLLGLDAPVRSEITGKDGAAIETRATIYALTDAELERIARLDNNADDSTAGSP